MNQEDIIKLAREAGLYVGRNLSGVQLVGSSYEPGGLLVHLTVEELERFAALVAEHEREACAKLCEADGLARGNEGLVAAYANKRLIKAAGRIRARGKP